MKIQQTVLFALAAIAPALPGWSQNIQINKENKTIAITATDFATQAADLAEVSLGFTTYGATQDATYADCSRLSNAIVQAVLDGGVFAGQVGNQSILLRLGGGTIGEGDPWPA